MYGLVSMVVDDECEYVCECAVFNGLFVVNDRIYIFTLIKMYIPFFSPSKYHKNDNFNILLNQNDDTFRHTKKMIIRCWKEFINGYYTFHMILPFSCIRIGRENAIFIFRMNKSIDCMNYICQICTFMIFKENVLFITVQNRIEYTRRRHDLKIINFNG